MYFKYTRLFWFKSTLHFYKDVIRLDFINFKFSIFTILIFSFVLIGIQVLVTELLVRNIEKNHLQNAYVLSKNVYKNSHFYTSFDMIFKS